MNSRTRTSQFTVSKGSTTQGKNTLAKLSKSPQGFILDYRQIIHDLTFLTSQNLGIMNTAQLEDAKKRVENIVRILENNIYPNTMSSKK